MYMYVYISKYTYTHYTHTHAHTHTHTHTHIHVHTHNTHTHTHTNREPALLDDVDLEAGLKLGPRIVGEEKVLAGLLLIAVQLAKVVICGPTVLECLITCILGLF
jgi:hypothetical protein